MRNAGASVCPTISAIGLKDGTYHVLIDSTLEPGSLTYGEAIIPGETEKEIFISTYICHPSMANDNVSGMVVAAFLADWIASQPRKHTYRIAFVPETIGSLCYLKQNLHKMRRTIAGFNLLACGDDRGYSFIMFQIWEHAGGRAYAACARP